MGRLVGGSRAKSEVAKAAPRSGPHLQRGAAAGGEEGVGGTEGRVANLAPLPHAVRAHQARPGSATPGPRGEGRDPPQGHLQGSDHL